MARISTTLYQEPALRQAAKAARLVYVRDDLPGITRKKHGTGYAYYDVNKRRITAKKTLARIQALAIPPAYTDVWICPNPQGHLQATGRDARRRKQYRYHPQWAAVRGQHKFDQIGSFAKALPAIRRTVRAHLNLRGLPREKVLAAIVSLMDHCQMRIGNDQYARENGSYGLTTIRKKHVKVRGDTIRFEFNGKSGKLWQRDVESPHIARIVKR